MQKSNIYGSGDRRDVNPNWFTGKMWMKDVSSGIESEPDIYHVHFADGSRTKLHRHNGSQILIVTAGHGSLEVFQRGDGGADSFGIAKTETVPLGPGDVVSIPAGSLHTHGSVDASSEFVHIAINNPPGPGGKYITDWYESDLESAASGRI